MDPHGAERLDVDEFGVIATSTAGEPAAATTVIRVRHFAVDTNYKIWVDHSTFFQAK